jgi:hypothetical protein
MGKQEIKKKKSVCLYTIKQQTKPKTNNHLIPQTKLKINNKKIKKSIPGFFFKKKKKKRFNPKAQSTIPLSSRKTHRGRYLSQTLSSTERFYWFKMSCI